MQPSEGNSPRGLRAAGATGIGWATMVDLPQPLVSLTTSSNDRPTTRLGYVGVTRCVEGRRGVGLVRQGLQWSDGELGRWLGFRYLQIKIHRRMGIIYRAFDTYSQRTRSSTDSIS
jgi:hypothetical protein